MGYIRLNCSLAACCCNVIVGSTVDSGFIRAPVEREFIIVPSVNMFDGMLALVAPGNMVGAIVDGMAALVAPVNMVGARVDGIGALVAPANMAGVRAGLRAAAPGCDSTV